MEKKLRVCWWDDSTVGHLVHRGAIYFVYDEAWLERGLDLSPMSLPFTNVAFNGSKGILGLPGLIADCLADTWGRKVARTEFAQNQWGEPTTMALLAWRGARGLGALCFELVLRARAAKLEAERANSPCAPTGNFGVRRLDGAFCFPTKASRFLNPKRRQAAALQKTPRAGGSPSCRVRGGCGFGSN